MDGHSGQHPNSDEKNFMNSREVTSEGTRRELAKPVGQQKADTAGQPATVSSQNVLRKPRRLPRRFTIPTAA